MSLKDFWLKHTDPDRYQEHVDNILAKGLTLNIKRIIYESLDKGANPATPDIYYSQIYGDNLSALEMLLDPYESYLHEDRAFSPAEKREIFQAFCQKTTPPTDLLTDRALELAAHYKGNEQVLAAMLDTFNPEIPAGIFIQNKTQHKKDEDMLAVLKIIRPYIDDVNVASEKSGINAGHAACIRAHVETFSWLNTQGLDHDPGDAPTSYAHALVAEPATISPYHANEDRKKLKNRKIIARYLANNNFPIDNIDKTGKKPTDLALKNGHIAIARTFLEAGAEACPAYMEAAVQSLSNSDCSVADVQDFLDYAHDVHGLPYERALTAAIEETAKGYRAARAIIDDLMAKGYQPAPSKTLDTALKTIWNEAKADNENLQLLLNTRFIRRNLGDNDLRRDSRNDSRKGPANG